MKKLITAIGWLLLAPFVLALGLEIYMLGKIVFVSGYYQDQMGSTELAYGTLFLLFASVVGLVGVVLIRRGRGRERSVFVGAALGAALGLIGGGALNLGLAVAVLAAFAGSALGGLMVCRGRRHVVNPIAL